MATFWKACNTCKSEIGFARDYYVCSVSTCRRKGTDFTFCSVECWEAHVPLFRHRDAGAEERRAPARSDAERASASVESRTSPGAAATPTESRPGGLAAATPTESRPAAAAAPAEEERPPLILEDRAAIPEDILVVVSKLKSYIRARSGMKTSDGVLPRLSAMLRDVCDEAIERAHADGRKTVMDRDFP